MTLIRWPGLPQRSVFLIKPQPQANLPVQSAQKQAQTLFKPLTQAVDRQDPVSYTPLDVYKRQVWLGIDGYNFMPGFVNAFKDFHGKIRSSHKDNPHSIPPPLPTGQACPYTESRTDDRSRGRMPSPADRFLFRYCLLYTSTIYPVSIPETPDAADRNLPL